MLNLHGHETTLMAALLAGVSGNFPAAPLILPFPPKAGYGGHINANRFP
jgi:hypothetical protein